MGDGSVSAVGGTGGIGREVARHYHERGHDVTITGRNFERTNEIAAAIGEPVPRAPAFDLAEPDTIAEAISGLGAVSRLVLSSIARDNNPVREVHHRRRHLPDDHEARRLHDNGACPRRPPLGGQLGVAVRWQAKDRPYPGSTGADRQRRHDRPGSYPGRRIGPGAVQCDPSRVRRRQPRMGEQAPRTLDRKIADRALADDGGGCVVPRSCWRTRP